MLDVSGISPAHSTLYLVSPEPGHSSSVLTSKGDGMIHHKTITPDGRALLTITKLKPN